MSFHGPLRAGLYSALFIFSVILLGLTASRVHHTKSLGRPDTISRGRTGYYGMSFMKYPTTVELLSTSILATLFSLPLMACLCSRGGFGLPHFMTELLGIICLFILYLVGSAIFTHKYRHIGYCRGFFSQCRIVSAIMAFSWMSWIITLFLLFAALAALFHFRKHGRETYDSRRHHRGAETAAVGAAGAAYGTQQHEKRAHENHGAGSTAAAAGTGTLAGGAAGHHGHHTGYDDRKGTTGTGYGTGTTDTGTNYGSNTGTGTNYGTGTGSHPTYNEAYRGTEPGTHHGTGGYTATPETRGVDNSGPVSSGYNTSAV